MSSRLMQSKSKPATPSALSNPSHTRPFSPLMAKATQSGGQALDRHTQTEMSAKFGHDFSQVRIHTDSRAEESAQAAGAHAFALGSDIVFGPGQYTPGSPHTERVLAHELTHVVQQSQFGMGDWGRMSQQSDASEREADSLASQVMIGQSVQVQSAPQAGLARIPDSSLFPGPETGPSIDGDSIGDALADKFKLGPFSFKPYIGPVAPDKPDPRDNPAQKRQQDFDNDQAKQHGDDYPNPMQGPSTADRFAKDHSDIFGKNPQLFPPLAPTPDPPLYLPPGGYNPMDPPKTNDFPGLPGPSGPPVPFPAPPDMTTPLPPPSLYPPAAAPVAPMVPPLTMDPITPPAGPDPSAPDPVPDSSPLPADQQYA